MIWCQKKSTNSVVTFLAPSRGDQSTWRIPSTTTTRGFAKRGHCAIANCGALAVWRQPLGPQKFGRVAVVVELFYRYANCTAEQPPTKPNEFKIHETAFKCAMWFKNPFKQTVFVLFFRAKMCVNRIKCERTSKTLSASLLNRWTTEQKQLLNWM